MLLLENGEVKAVPESDLPVTLPEIDEFTPTGTGEPPLAKATSWVSISLIMLVCKEHLFAISLSLSSFS